MANTADSANAANGHTLEMAGSEDTTYTIVSGTVGLILRRYKHGLLLFGLIWRSRGMLRLDAKEMELERFSE